MYCGQRELLKWHLQTVVSL